MKRPTTSVRRVSAAQAQLAAAERDLDNSMLAWQRRLQRNRSVIALVSGFSAGLALSLLPTRWWASAGATLGTTAASTARSALAPAILAAVLSHLLSGENASRESVPAGDVG